MFSSLCRDNSLQFLPSTRFCQPQFLQRSRLCLLMLFMSLLHAFPQAFGFEHRDERDDSADGCHQAKNYQDNNSLIWRIGCHSSWHIREGIFLRSRVRQMAR